MGSIYNQDKDKETKVKEEGCSPLGLDNKKKKNNKLFTGKVVDFEFRSRSVKKMLIKVVRY